jgi:hypothetical protein
LKIVDEIVYEIVVKIVGKIVGEIVGEIVGNIAEVWGLGGPGGPVTPAFIGFYT